MTALQIVLTATVLTVAISLDSASAGFAYGANKTKFPFINLFVLSLIDTSVLTLSLLLGDGIGRIIPPKVTVIISCVILCIMGLRKIWKWHRKQRIGIIYKEESAVSWKETVMLGFALSVDGMAVGVGIAMTEITAAFLFTVIAFSICTDILIFSAGNLIAKRLTKKSRFDLSWLSGLIFIIIAIQKFFF